MQVKNVVFVILIMILSPVAVIFLMGAIGPLLGSDPSGLNIVIVGIAILCDVVIGCTLIVIGVLSRVIRMVEEQKPRQ